QQVPRHHVRDGRVLCAALLLCVPELSVTVAVTVAVVCTVAVSEKSTASVSRSDRSKNVGCGVANMYIKLTRDELRAPPSNSDELLST
ncbi:MAG TPA: hypothetical protein VN903_37780, partial [Polyangia bacterium]|nr:hypothetical protein [Polyangia bacterium]